MNCDFENLKSEIIKLYQGDLCSIHGIYHWERVEQHAIWIAKRSGADMEIVRIFAWVHDACRLNDLFDPEHGLRASKLAEKLNGSAFHLSSDRLDTLKMACEFHTTQKYTQNQTVATCWDADRLDLGRVGVIPSSDFMNTQFGKKVAEEGSFYSLLNDDELNIKR